MIRLEPRGDGEAGYSLLEIMIALTIMALAATLAAPSLFKGLSTASRFAALEELDSQLVQLRRDAVARGLSIRLSENGSPLAAPNGWSLAADPRIEFLPTGACIPGSLSLQTASQAREVRISGDTCRLQP